MLKSIQYSCATHRDFPITLIGRNYDVRQRKRERKRARQSSNLFTPVKIALCGSNNFGSASRMQKEFNASFTSPSLPLSWAARARCTHITSASPLSPRTRRRSRLWRFSPGIEEDETTVSGVYDGVHTLRKQLYPLARTNDPYLCRRRDHPRRPCAFAHSRPFLALLATPVLLFALYRAATCVYGRRISMWSA